MLGTVTAHIPFIGIYAGALNTLPGKLYAFGFIVAAAMLYLLAHDLSEYKAFFPEKQTVPVGNIGKA